MENIEIKTNENVQRDLVVHSPNKLIRWGPKVKIQSLFSNEYVST